MATFRMRPGLRKSDPNPQSSRSLSAKFGARLRARRRAISCCASQRRSDAGRHARCPIRETARELAIRDRHLLRLPRSATYRVIRRRRNFRTGRGQSTIRSDDDCIPSSINTTGVVVLVNPYGAHTRTICGK